MNEAYQIRKRSLGELARQRPTYLFSTIIAAMGYAKSRGFPPGDFVDFYMSFQVEWEQLRGNIEGVFQAFVQNFQMHTEMLDDEFKVIADDRGVSLVAAPIEDLFQRDVERYGLTPEEVRDGWARSARIISEFTGLQVRYDYFDERLWIHIVKPPAK